MELIDRTALLKEIENSENKPKNNDKADLIDWILECIKNAPVISDTNTDAKADIQAGQYVYVIVKDRWTKVSEILKCYVLKKIIKPNQIPKYRICSHYANGDYYESTITEKAIGITMFTGSEEAKETLKKKQK